MDTSKLPSEILGYHFIIFQSNLRGFVKCWIDGSENYKYFTEKDFIDIFSKVNSPNDLLYDVISNLCTTGIYIWDIDNYKVSRLQNLPEQPSLMSEVNKLNPFKKKF